MEAIRVEELTRRYGGVDVVDHVSFRVPEGKVFGFMGHNGAGKTTTLRMLLGLCWPTSGRGEVLGCDIVRESLAIRRLTGFLPAEYSLPREMTAVQFLHYVAAMFDMGSGESRRRVAELVELFGIGPYANRKLASLSTGMAQKVGLAQAVLNRPRLLLLDEPTAGLDPLGRHDFLQYIRGLARDEGVTVLFSTHILGDIESICEDVAILHQGRLLAAGQLAALKAEHAAATMDDLYLQLVRRPS
ncbi:ABC transporter ATP-binding protein [Chondromyces apiculatus]|uniref:ABC-type transport system, ATPase component n=1 Tax=Chondromyces apiculatus DSM 436 TaxID=1192034 RepID=A0A017T815_9BACT|nr:ABC transporter ATP-binding protein [Chondromyces apiculatus]EYF04736.1 ABC-type transport system, ATPase component [Chondromyces apiculatus DSM 436]